MLAFDPSLQLVDLPTPFNTFSPSTLDYFAADERNVYVIRSDDKQTIVTRYDRDGRNPKEFRLDISHPAKSIHNGREGNLLLLDNMSNWYILDKDLESIQHQGAHIHFVGNDREGYTDFPTDRSPHQRTVIWNGHNIPALGDVSYLDAEGLFHNPCGAEITAGEDFATTHHVGIYHIFSEQTQIAGELGEPPLGPFAFVDDNTLVASSLHPSDNFYHTRRLLKIELTRNNHLKTSNLI